MNDEKTLRRSPLSLQVDLSKFSSADFEPASEEEKSQQEVMSESVTFFRDGMRRLRKNPLGMASVVVLVLMVAINLRQARQEAARQRERRAASRA